MLIIGDKINGTIDTVRTAIKERNAAIINNLAISQENAGADYIDVNVGSGDEASEIESMVWALGLVMSSTKKPVALDSSDPRVLQKGLEICGESKPFINSVDGTRARLEETLPLVASYGSPVIALGMDESGIPASPEGRFEVCRRIYEKALDLGIHGCDVYFDALVLPISTDITQARTTLDTLALLKKELPDSATILGLSNISFGLPRRSIVNRTLLSIAAFLGLDAVLMDPTDRELSASIYAAEAVLGHDSYCAKYLKAYRGGFLG